MADIYEISERLEADLKQNDHCTSEPMFCLQIKVRDCGYDARYCDNRCWYDPERLEMIYDDDDDFQDSEDLDNLQGPFGYKDRWETVMVALTQKGIDDYLELHGHNVERKAFRREIRTYVESFNRCEEMTSIRSHMLTLSKESGASNG